MNETESIAVLRESVRNRCQQARPGLLGALVVSCFLCIALTWENVGTRMLALWVVPMLGGLGVRFVFATRCLKGIDTANDRSVRSADKFLFRSSAFNQLVAGSGIWSVGVSNPQHVTLLVTLVICLYSVAAMVNLSTDYRSAKMTLPLIMGQVVAYWATQGFGGFGIAAMLFLLLLLMLGSAARGHKTFVESVLMRFEKDALLRIAESANRAKAQFLAAASHDLRQPLYALALLTDTLRSHAIPPAASLLVEQQLRAIAVLRGLFDNLLDLSRFEAGHIQPVIGNHFVREIIEPLEFEFSTLCREKGLSWRVLYADAHVSTDASLVSRLLRNLLSNAVRYTEMGVVQLSVEVSKDDVTLTVSDTGEGISQDEQERVFEEFVQLDNPQRDRERGVGLGLAIVRRICDALDLPLTLDSAQGRGSSFSVVLPRAQAFDVPISSLDPVVAEFPRLDGLHVWVVEDDALVRAALALQLTALGCEPYVMGNAQQLQDRVEQGEALPDTIIVDDMLGPPMNGFELAESMADWFPREHVLIMTGNPNPKRLSQIERSGYRLVSKPVPQEQLLEWLQRFAR